MADAWNDLLKVTQAVKEYAGGSGSELFVQLLETLAQVYRRDLESVDISELVKTQTALRQTVLIRDLLAGTSDQPPKV